VLDFGLAKEVRLFEPESATLTSAGQTAVNVMMGTPSYMSPEQVTGRPIDARTDIFALGIILYELASGRRPFAAASGAELMSAILRETPRPISELRPDLPQDLVHAISRCLEKDPAARFPSALALLDELRRLKRPERSPRSAFTRPAVLVPAAVVLLAAIAIGAWTTISRNRRAVFVAGALPRIEALAKGEDYIAAFNLAREVERVGGAAAVPDGVWTAASGRVSITSDPVGARITVSPRRRRRDGAGDDAAQGRSGAAWRAPLARGARRARRGGPGRHRGRFDAEVHPPAGRQRGCGDGQRPGGERQTVPMPETRAAAAHRPDRSDALIRPRRRYACTRHAGLACQTAHTGRERRRQDR
jgi:hypothetical protein